MEGSRNREVFLLEGFLGTILLVKPSFLHIDRAGTVNTVTEGKNFKW